MTGDEVTMAPPASGSAPCVEAVEERRGSKLPRYDNICFALLLVQYAFVILVFTSPTAAPAIYLWSSMWTYCVMVWALLRFLDSPRRMSLAATTIVAVNAIVVLYGLNQVAGMDALVELGIIPDWGSGVFVSTFGNRNFFAGYVLTVMPVVIGLCFHERRPARILALALLAGLDSFTLIRLFSFNAETALLAALPAGLLLFAVNMRHFPEFRAKATRLRFAGRCALLAFAIVAGALVGRGDCDCALCSALDQWRNACPEAIARVSMYRMAVDGALRNPFFGQGIGSFNQRMPEARPADYHREAVGHNSDHAHNELLEWLHDTGVVGLSFFCLVLVACARAGLRLLRRHRNGRYFPLVFFSFFGPWNLWLHAMNGVETRWTGNGVALWFGVGFVLAFANLPVEESDAIDQPAPAALPNPARGRFSWRVAILAIAMLAVVGFYLVEAGNFWEADHHLRNNMAFTDASRGSAEAALQEAEEAQHLCYMNMSSYYKLAYTYLVVGKMDRAMNAYRDLQSFAPNYAQIHINLGFLDDQMDYRSASAWERDRAAVIEFNMKNHMDAAAYWAGSGSFARAIPHLRHALIIDFERDPTTPRYCDSITASWLFWPDRDTVHAQLARFYEANGESAKALMELREVHAADSAVVTGPER